MDTDADMNTVQHTVTESDTDIVKHNNEQRLRPTLTWKRHRRRHGYCPTRVWSVRDVNGHERDSLSTWMQTPSDSDDEVKWL